jgi:hypothetical protein
MAAVAAACPTWAAWTSRSSRLKWRQSEGRLSRAALLDSTCDSCRSRRCERFSYRGSDYSIIRGSTESNAAGCLIAAKPLRANRFSRQDLPVTRNLHIQWCISPKRIARLSICLYRLPRSSLLQPILTPGEPIHELLMPGVGAVRRRAAPTSFQATAAPGAPNRSAQPKCRLSGDMFIDPTASAGNSGGTGAGRSDARKRHAQRKWAAR